MENNYGEIKGKLIPQKVLNQGPTGTCFAFAISASILYAEARIWGRKPKKNFDQLTEHFVKKSKEINIGKKDSDGKQKIGLENHECLQLTQQYCNNNSLGCQTVDLQNAKKALENNRAVQYSFYLSDNQWNKFSQFILYNKDSWTTAKQNLDKYMITPETVKTYNDNSKIGGHLVCLIYYDRQKQFFVAQNSWGQELGVNGNLLLSESFVKTFTNGNYYCDVFFRIKDLPQSETQDYEQYIQKYGNADKEFSTEEKCPTCSQVLIQQQFTIKEQLAFGSIECDKCANKNIEIEQKYFSCRERQHDYDLCRQCANAKLRN